MKKCGKCKSIKNDNEFSPSQFKRSGGICRKCNTEICCIYRENNADKIKKYNQQYDGVYYQVNKDKILENKQKYYQANKEIILQDRHKYYQKHIKDKLKYSKHYYQIHRLKLIFESQRYYKNNKDHIRQYHNKYYKIRRKTDPNFRIRTVVSANINFYLRLNNSNKQGGSCLNYLPFTIEELRRHLERQLESWMSWNNYGKYDAKSWNDDNITTWTWQIDHIIPQSELPYSSMQDDNFKSCWALENLRPYSAKQNFFDGVLRIRHNSTRHVRKKYLSQIVSIQTSSP